MLKSVDCRVYMTDHPVTFLPDTNIFTVIHELLVHKISGATVLDANNHVVGVISQGDCLKAILDGSYHGYANGTAGEVMSTTIETVNPNIDVLEVSRALLNNKRIRLPVVEHGKFIGEISIRSILRAVKEFDVPADPTEQ